jgi:Transglycosylase SLT domain
MKAPQPLQRLLAPLRVFAQDAAQGLLLVSHNGLAMVGLSAIAVALVAMGRPDMRQDAEQWVYGWLHERHGTAMMTSAAAPDAVLESARIDTLPAANATAADPADLTKAQAAVAIWISRRYKVAPEPISKLVQEAWEVGAKLNIEPTLILAVMAVESSFNPFAQSSVGAQGLMQVMTHVHDKKYLPFGGVHAAFDPVTNLRVGVQVLKECISRAGSVYDGLRHYVGAANLPTDSGYAGKVLGEHQNMKKIAAGVAVPHTVRIVPVPAPVAPQAVAPAPVVEEADNNADAPSTKVSALSRTPPL